MPLPAAGYYHHDHFNSSVSAGAEVPAYRVFQRTVMNCLGNDEAISWAHKAHDVFPINLDIVEMLGGVFFRLHRCWECSCSSVRPTGRKVNAPRCALLVGIEPCARDISPPAVGAGASSGHLRATVVLLQPAGERYETAGMPSIAPPQPFRDSSAVLFSLR